MPLTPLSQGPLLTPSRWTLLFPQMSDLCCALREASGDMLDSLPASVGTHVPRDL